jgi:hypothetical protein
MKSLVSFVAGLVLGAALLFGFEHLPSTSTSVTSTAPVAAAVAAQAPVAAAVPSSMVAGTWQGSLQLQGQEIPFSLAITETGTRISAIASSSQVGDVPCDHVAVDHAGNISFTVHYQDKDATFTGKLAPDSKSMMGSATTSVGSGDWTLAKNKS